MSKRNVLVVDDDKLIRSVLRSYLVVCGFDVEMAADGLEAIKVLKSKNFDLIFSDYEMPNMNGIQFLERAKCLPDKMNVPIIMLTTVDNPNEIEKARVLGAAGYMIKPFTNEKMQEVLKHLNFM